jgi:prepilin-type N-terminal cleavage/methylation domain-containing protein
VNRSRHFSPAPSAFSLVELLVVVALIGLLSILVAPAFVGQSDARSLSRATYDINGALELARTTAIAKNTYVWVGFFEEDATSGNRQAGVGRVLVSIVMSKDGTRTYANNNTNPPPFTGTRLSQIQKLIKVDRVHLDILDADDVPGRDSIPADKYQVASPAFNSAATFNYPITGASQYTFAKVIQFNPLGDATRVADLTTRLIEIGLRPARGNTALSQITNLATIQLQGIGGQSTIHRP